MIATARCRSIALAVLFLAVALLACGGSKSKCAATVTFDGKPGQGTGDGAQNATESACIDWCVQHDAAVEQFYQDEVASKSAGRSRFSAIYDEPGGSAVVEPCKRRCTSLAKPGKELRVNCS